MKGRIARPTPGTHVGLPRIGTIKVGIKEKGRNGKEYPRSVDYFVASGKYAALFTRAYGDKPQTIQIIFPDDDAEKVCNEKYEYRDDDGRLVATGDGETFQVWNGQKYQELTTEEYPTLMESICKRYPNRLVREGKDGWMITLTLTFIVPMVRGIGGVWQFVTKGVASSIPNIREAFDIMLQEKKKVRGVIWDLNVQFAKSQKPGVNSKYPVVSIVPNESEGNLQKITEAFKPIKLLESK